MLRRRYRDMSLSTFTPDANVVIAGASGGIGAELVRACRTDERVRRVFALQRSATTNSGPRVENLTFDLLDEASVQAAAQQVADHGPVDLVIVATGFLHDERFAPEKSLQAIETDAMLHSYRINAVGPVLLAKHFLPLMRKNAKTCFAAISARVGSIGDNRLGGWASYRASKAALNMLLRTAAIEHKRRRPESIVVALHPGTVDTRLSAPFQGGVPEGKLFAPVFSAEKLIDVIDGLNSADTGNFYAWDGQRIEY
jgi:NAD(P)-dependent dehydrogenase (short-subunit alcohol dehydrogenase family)